MGPNTENAGSKTALTNKSLYSRLRAQVSRRRTNAWRLYGDSIDHQNLAVNYAGMEINKEYIKETIFGNNCREEAVGRIWKFKAKQMVKPHTSLHFTEYDTEQNDIRSRNSGFMIPFWLGWVADITGDLKKIIKSNRTLEYNLGKIRRNNLEYEIVDSLDEFESFFDNMYLPYIGIKYENTAQYMSREAMRQQHETCKLLYVKRGQEYLSGLLIKYEPEYPRIWSIGVKDASREYIRDGAIGALYYYLISYLKETGHPRVSFGATRSFLSDGVLGYKKKWPIQNVGFSKQGFYFQTVSKSTETINMLTESPFIFVEDEKLNSAVFIGPEDEVKQKDFKKKSKSYRLNGMNKVALYVFGDRVNEIKDMIPREYQDHFFVRSADDLFVD